MKIAVASDIHLEFGPIVLENTDGADVLILSGDICTASQFKKKPKERMIVKDFFKQCSLQFPHVVYIMGNHEHYNFDITNTYDRLKAELADLPNIHVLEKEIWEHDGVTFVAGTLWTDMNKGDSLTLWHCDKVMSDFKVIRNSNRMVQHKKNVYHETERNEDGTLIVKTVEHYQAPSRWSAEDCVEDHKKMLDYINISTQDKSKCYVVVTHHAPSPISISSQYKNAYLMNGAFASDLSEFIMDRPQIKLWTHGHMHDPSDYLVDETRVVCNPRGYAGYEQRAKDFKLKYLEI